MYVLCNHSTTTIHRFEYNGTDYTYERCDTCGLTPDTAPITASGPNELLPWWDWKPISGKRITDARPGINRVQAQRTAARDEVMLLQELIAFEHELGEAPDPALAAELDAAQAYRASLGHVFVAN